ncbi:MAG: helix-turn-helix transcriptional regulator [Acidobacteriia bacterium]|nr:helix-turn-helix transcriptional regulator [Terriglobia bacterium]
MTLAFPEIEEEMYSPTHYKPIAPSGIVATAAIAFAFMAGTGGVTTAEYLQQRGYRGYQFVQIPALAGPNAGVRLPMENLKIIRAAFKPSMLDLASLLGVSRQAVYNWMAGENPSRDSADRLEDLAKAADLVAAYGLNSPYLLRRKISDGRTLMEIVRDGGSAHEAARSLIGIVEKEAEQRDQLRKSLAGRKPSRLDRQEFGMPMLDE